MQSLTKLLNVENSQLAKFMKANLIGLSATLKSAKEQFPHDPGVNICEELLTELEQLIVPNIETPELLPIPIIEPETDSIPSLNTLIEVVENQQENQPPQLLTNALDPRLNVDNNNPDLLELRQIISFFLNAIETDHNLEHCYQNIYRFGIRNLDSDHDRNNYINYLVDYFKRISKAENNNDLIESLRQRINLDEAIHSLKYNVVNNEWEKMQKRERDLLFEYTKKARETGSKIILRNLNGAYSEICQLSKNDYGLEIRGIRGEVIACLRVYAKIDQQEILGRVLYHF